MPLFRRKTPFEMVVGKTEARRVEAASEASFAQIWEEATTPKPPASSPDESSIYAAEMLKAYADGDGERMARIASGREPAMLARLFKAAEDAANQLLNVVGPEVVTEWLDGLSRLGRPDDVAYNRRLMLMIQMLSDRLGLPNDSYWLPMKDRYVDLSDADDCIILLCLITQQAVLFAAEEKGEDGDSWFREIFIPNVPFT